MNPILPALPPQVTPTEHTPLRDVAPVLRAAGVPLPLDQHIELPLGSGAHTDVLDFAYHLAGLRQVGGEEAASPITAFSTLLIQGTPAGALRGALALLPHGVFPPAPPDLPTHVHWPHYLAAFGREADTPDSLSLSERFKALSRAGRPFTPDDDGESPIALAVVNGNTATLHALIEAGVEWRTHEPPLLHLAAQAGRKDMISTLLQLGTRLTALDAQGRQALHIAAAEGQQAAIDALLEAGARIDTPCTQGNTALMLAAINRHSEALAQLLARGAAVGDADDYGMTALHLAAAAGHTDCMVLLLKAGADLEAQNARRARPLHGAALHGRLDATDLLLKLGAAPDTPLADGLTPLHLAAIARAPRTLAHLLEAGANPHAQDQDGQTALHLAAERDQLDQARALLDAGADPSALSLDEATPIDLAHGKLRRMLERALSERRRAALSAPLSASHNDANTPPSSPA